MERWRQFARVPSPRDRGERQDLNSVKVPLHHPATQDPQHAVRNAHRMIAGASSRSLSGDSNRPRAQEDWRRREADMAQVFAIFCAQASRGWPDPRNPTAKEIQSQST